MADDELDSLYGVPPDGFTAQRTQLAAAAKQRGDDAAAKKISAARKPTTAAWIVNRLVLGQKDARQRLAELGDRLRAAHASLDGDSIRELSAEQHKLINELARAAFTAAGVTPSAAVRDDVTGTLQAAIADPDARNRLGRLARPERWSGFGAFDEAAPVTPVSQPIRSKKADRAAEQSSPQPAQDRQRDRAAQRERAKLDAAVATAERDKATADGMLAERQADRDAARQRRSDAQTALHAAERQFDSAEARYQKAKQASRAAAESVREAKAQLKGK